MYIVLYNFEVKINKEDDFIKAWKGLTELIYKHEGSLGSRLHKSNAKHYLAYAQWPNQQTFENSGNKLPEKANEFRQLMRASCEKIEVLYKMEMLEDLLRTKQSE